ncbi:MAG: hypothetical protein F6K24_31315 [Okeania sp. SIO2D1]|nr:hypothetical protein [Okeania sp. SIO2D1]
MGIQEDKSEDIAVKVCGAALVGSVVVAGVAKVAIDKFSKPREGSQEYYKERLEETQEKYRRDLSGD